MNTCFIYCRKSSEDKDKQILSLNDQERTCADLAKDNGFEVLGIYKESKSAKRPDKRASFKEMLGRIKKGEAKIVLCWKADRLSRNAKEGGALIDEVDYENLKIITPSMAYDRNNSTFLFIEFGMATKFSKDLSDNVKRGLKTKLQMGHYPAPAPLGYFNDKAKAKGAKDIIVDPTRFDLCRRWWDLMLTGKETVESSLAKVTKMGLTSKRTGEGVSKTEAFRYFRNIFYAGMFDYGGERYNGAHKAMIKLAEYNRVQEIIDGRSRVHKNQNNYFFMKVLKCGECGSSITCEKHTKNYKNGNSQTFVYARCTKKKGECSQSYINADELEKQTIAFVDSLRISHILIDWIRSVLKRRNQKEFDIEKSQKSKQTKRLQAILTEKKEVYGMKIDGIVSEEDYQKEKKRLMTEEKQLKENIGSDGLASWTSIMEETLAFASNVTQIFKKGDPETKRMVLRILGSNLILKDQKVRIIARKAFIFLKTAEKVMNGEIAWLEPKKDPISGSYLVFSAKDSDMERLAGIEPASSPWQGDILPMNHSRGCRGEDSNLNLTLFRRPP